jgi:rhamnogalacturonyl hydrolase YesR
MCAFKIPLFCNEDDAMMYATGYAVDGPAASIDPDKRLTRGWNAFPVVPGQTTRLRWNAFPAVTDAVRLRVSVAIDERESKQVEAVLPDSGRIVGVLDIRYAHIFQPFEILISAEDANAIRTEGLVLRLHEGSQPLWLLHDPAGQAEPALMPHLLVAPPADPLAAMIDRLASTASLQFFGWQEGCVLNGLMDLADAGVLAHERAFAAIESHFRHFFTVDGQLSYEDDWSRPREGEIYGIECTLPFAVLAQWQPTHPALRAAVAFWLAKERGGRVQDDDLLSAEGGYTVAYPMTQLALTLDEPALMTGAMQQLRLRRDRLFVDDALYLRAYDDGRRSFRNWCRGAAWYLLGLARTLALTPSDELTVALLDAAAWVVQMQQPDGLWACFVDEPRIAPDTAGSAGIAAALALGVQHGLLDATYIEPARRALAGLTGYLTPDGFLSGVAQVNKAGEGLQRSDYRVISQMASGMMAQLVAALTVIERETAARP